MFNLPRLDIQSFWLGFIAATLFWFLFSRVRPLFPKFIAWYKKYAREMRLRNLEGVNESLRKETIRRAQRAHLASSLFMLDEVLVQPRLLAPPPEVVSGEPSNSQSIADLIIPYLPDWPELSSPYGVPTLTLAEALQRGAHIAVVGRPGSGKTVALANLACQISRQDAAVGNLSDRIPLYFHILDLDTKLSEEKADPLDNLHKVFFARVSVMVQNQLSRFLLDQFTEGNVLLIVDGLDEIPPASLPPVSVYFAALLEKFPKTKFIAAANFESINGLGKLGFVSLALAAWNDQQRKEYLEYWSQNWTAYISPEVFRQTSIQPVSPLLINSWLRGEKGAWSPLEWALKVWGAYSGDLKAISPVGALETYVSRFIGGPVTRPALEALAREFINQGQPALSYNHLEKVLTAFAPAQAESQQLTAEVSAGKQGKSASKKGGDLISSAGELMLIALTNQGLLIEHPNSMISLVNPMVAGYLACFAASHEDIELALQSSSWSFSQQTLRYAALQGREIGWIEPYLQNEDLPLYRHLLTAARWLPDSSSNLSWRSTVLRSLAGLVQNEMLPFSLRARFVAAFVTLNDASVSKLFQQLLTSQSPAARQLAALGAGAYGDPAMTNHLVDLLGDIELNVRCAACFALSAIRTDQALSVVAGALMQGDEGLRQAAAESLIHIPDIGAETIKEAAQVDDLLTRRAAVFGLLQLRQPWSTALLESMAVQDGQWVVRNASAQALEEVRSPNPHIPKPLPLAWESPWLIEFAAKRGQGVLPGETPIETLLLALVSGTGEDQAMAIKYLKDHPDEKVIIALFKLFYGDQPEMQELALQTLQYLVASAIELPSPQKFGYG